MAILQAISFRRSGAGAAGRAGFTLIELMIAVGLFSLVIAGSLGVYIMCQRMWRATSLSMDTSRMASLAIERMVYGVGNNGGLRAAASIWGYHLNFASRQFGADARRAECRCISILQTPRNKADAPKLRERLFQRTSAFLRDAFITRWVSAQADPHWRKKEKWCKKQFARRCY